jgi:hypothetical protein
MSDYKWHALGGAALIAVMVVAVIFSMGYSPM